MINRAFTQRHLKYQNMVFCNTGGTSQGNRYHHFVPAFLDSEQGDVFRSCHRDGSPSAIHLLEGLPEHLVLKRDDTGNVTAAKESIISGFLRNNLFYTREEAAQIVKKEAELAGLALAC
ncbi:MAG: hypothetical protein GXP10_02090 [Gammaproteobacteria bacterium]|nr:hypothetical protein [Gammaproteobacteria bacterium]